MAMSDVPNRRQGCEWDWNDCVTTRGWFPVDYADSLHWEKVERQRTAVPRGLFLSPRSENSRKLALQISLWHDNNGARVSFRLVSCLSRGNSSDARERKKSFLVKRRMNFCSKNMFLVFSRFSVRLFVRSAIYIPYCQSCSEWGL